MTRHPPSSPTSLAPRLAGLAALALIGITCQGREPVGPGLPSNASLAVAPRMQQAAAAGGPSFVSMRTLHGVLTPVSGAIGGGVAGAASYSVSANFVGDTATLEFSVSFPGASQRYTLALAATDTAGDTLFRSMREVVAIPGANDPVSEVMTYVAPDTAVRMILMTPADSMVLAGDTLAITATGFDATQKPISPLYLGWASRDTNLARVISSGPSSARVVGGSIESPVWIVGRAFNGVADSVSIKVALKVGSLVLSADTIHVLAGALAKASVKVLDALGGALDRPVSFVSLDTSIMTVATLIDVSAPTAQLTGVRVGTTKLIASSGGKADTAVVVVDPIPVATVQIIPDSIALLPGDSGRFSVVLLGAAGDTLTGRPISWGTGSTSITTVSAAGTVKGIAVGRTFITATSEGVVDTAWVNVVTTGTSIVRTVVSPKTLHLSALGATAQLVAQGYAGDSSLVPGHYTWTVRQSVPLLSVDSLGGVTALAVGSAWVVATEKSGTADSAQVTIDQLLPTAQATSAGAASIGLSSRATAAVPQRDVAGTPLPMPVRHGSRASGARISTETRGVRHRTVALPMRLTRASVQLICSSIQAEAPCRRRPIARSASSFAERAKPASATRIL